MSSTAEIIAKSLPQEMQQHTYSIMYKVEGVHWWFVGRRQIISSFVSHIVGRLPEDQPRILDVGCGTGANLELLGQFGSAEGVDVSVQALEFCRARGLTEVREGEAERLPFDDESFDLVTGLDVVEHLDDDLAGLREMYRVLRPGGYALVFVPAFMFLWGVQDDISHHRRRYTMRNLKGVVREAGFKVERATYVNITFFAPILLGRLLMRLTGFRPASENNLTLKSINGILGKIFGAERFLLKHVNFPFGVSIICVAQRIK
jgi:SAM-dependent methyltransferase